jgi:DNA-binding transcriptional LysR family regulator
MLVGMELRQLRYFVAVAENGNISRAAKQIFLTQPALSRQIKALENEIGLALLERRAHSFQLTPVGELLLREARELLQHADQMEERIRRAAQGIRLRLGYAPSLASGLLSTAVENFIRLHPEARLELFDLSTVEMRAGLQNETLDLILSVAPERATSGLQWTPLGQTPWQLAVSHKHPLARRPQVTPAEIAAEPLLALCQRDYPEYWEWVSGWLRGHRLQPRVAGEHDGAESLMAAVEAGLGVALVTTRTANLFPGRVCLKTLDPAPPPVCIAAGYQSHRAADRPLVAFVEELRRTAGETG